MSGGHPIPHFICKTGPLKEIFQDIWDKYVVGEGGGSPLVWSPALVFQPPGGGWGGGGGEGGGSQLENSSTN